MEVKAFWTQKEGNLPEEYEDAFALSKDKYSFAISDGATESSFSKEWAELLAIGFLKSPLRCKKKFVDWLKPLQRKWFEKVDWEGLPWFAQQKAREGAFATFLGLHLKTNGRWLAVSIGDANLFKMREGNLKVSFPILSSGEFSNTPPLISSNPLPFRNPNLKVKYGKWQKRDSFILCTDALAAWFLRNFEAGSKPWDLLLSLRNLEEFRKLIKELRDKGLIRNDDTTLLIICL